MIELSPRVLRWARERAGLSLEDVASKTGASTARVLDWESTGRLRRGQLERLARATHTPIGLLYLPDPPAETLPIPDFRTVGDELPERPSPELLDTLDDAERRQGWYRDYLISIDAEPLPFVGSLREIIPVAEAATRIGLAHGLTVEGRRSARTWEDGLRHDIAQVEESGILVLRNGVVGSNTHRPLNVDEFRGFALVDEYAPLIFLNGRDSKAAQFFTLAHELVHVWLGRSGVSNLKSTLPPDTHIERFSNQVAAELLVPAERIAELWPLHGRSLSSLPMLVRYFKVSSLVVLRRLFDLGYVDWDTFRNRYQAEEERFHGRATPDDEGGGDFYRTQVTRVSRRFASALVSDVLGGRTSWRDAYSFLGIRKSSTFNEFARHLGFEP
jgi:Zn-dependent peptidase ImmA (M78 family)